MCNTFKFTYCLLKVIWAMLYSLCKVLLYLHLHLFCCFSSQAFYYLVMLRTEEGSLTWVWLRLIWLTVITMNVSPRHQPWWRVSIEYKILRNQFTIVQKSQDVLENFQTIKELGPSVHLLMIFRCGLLLNKQYMLNSSNSCSFLIPLQEERSKN